MKIKTETKVGGIRLPIAEWEKMRALMSFHRGRGWLIKILNREYKKITRTKNEG